jgi:hypothetical protein
LPPLLPLPTAAAEALENRLDALEAWRSIAATHAA